jgi:hypothetical protein
MRPDDVSGRLAADDSEPVRRQAVKAGAVAPPLRGFGLDGLTPSRFELSKQTKADWERSRFQSRTERQRAELDDKNFPRLNADLSLGPF